MVAADHPVEMRADPIVAVELVAGGAALEDRLAGRRVGGGHQRLDVHRFLGRLFACALGFQALDLVGDELARGVKYCASTAVWISRNTSRLPQNAPTYLVISIVFIGFLPAGAARPSHLRSEAF